jgi:hypothetical protein
VNRLVKFMITTSLTLHDSEDNVIATVSGTFSPDDIELLQCFIGAMARVRGTVLLKRGLPSITHFKWSRDGLEFSCEPYSDPELFELLHVLRHVILSKEATSFEKVVALLSRCFKNRDVADHLKVLRKLFDNGELSSYGQISVDSQKLFDRSLLNIWLNGTQYHTDKEKAKAWAKLEGCLELENARALVMNQLHGRVEALFELEHIVNLILLEQT